MERKNKEKCFQFQPPESEERKESKRFFETSFDISAIDQNETVKQDQFETDSVLDGSNLLQHSQEENLHNESTFQDPITVIDQEKEAGESQEGIQQYETSNDKIYEISFEDSSSLQKTPNQNQAHKPLQPFKIEKTQQREEKQSNQRQQNTRSKELNEQQTSHAQAQIQKSQRQKKVEFMTQKPLNNQETQEGKKQANPSVQSKNQKHYQNTNRQNINKSQAIQKNNVFVSYEDFLQKIEPKNLSQSQIMANSKAQPAQQDIQELKQKAEQKLHQIQKIKEEKKKQEIESIKQAVREREIIRKKKHEAAVYIQKI